METKKISFGFSKVSKKPNLLPTKENAKQETKLEFIKCLEGQEIKLVEEKQEQKPLVIPLKDSQKTSAGLASLIKRRAVLLGEDVVEESENKSMLKAVTLNNEGPEDIEKRAARELLAEVQKNISSDTTNNLVLPVVKPDELPLEGAKESTLDDYENIPITDFGKAMLRGMGWTEPLANTNKKGRPPPDETPTVRPKGMGLGAEKALRKKTLLVAPDVNEVLEIKRNAFVRILGGKFKDLYGQIEGFDDHAGMVIIKLAIGGAKETFNEFLCQPVSRKEYAQYGKCINSSKYEEYKKKENRYGQITADKPHNNIVQQKETIVKNEEYDARKCQNKKDEYDYKHGRYEDYKEKKDIKRENDIIKIEEKRRSSDYERDNINQSKDTDRTHREKYDGITHRTKDRKDDVRYSRREDDKYGLKSETYSDHLKDYSKDKPNRNYRDCERSSNKDRSGQRDHSRSQYRKDYSSDSESDSNSYKQRISTTFHSKKKSKKSKKSKSKYNSSTDTETTNSLSSNDEQKSKKHKKKTKKSKKQRERSRSRGRR